MDEFQRLALLVQELEEADSEINARIGIAMGLPTEDRTGQPGWKGRYFTGRLPNYTGSTDDAIELLQPEWNMKLQKTDGSWYASMSNPFVSGTNRKTSPTPALAITVGALLVYAKHYLPYSPTDA